MWIYFDGEKEAGRVAAHALPDWPVDIEGYGQRWVSRFDMDATLTPGMKRLILDAETGEERAWIQLFWEGPAICLGGDKVMVERSVENYAFLRNGQEIGWIRLAEDEGDAAQAFGQSWPLGDVAWFRSDVGEKLRLCALAYPLLRFA